MTPVNAINAAIFLIDSLARLTEGSTKLRQIAAQAVAEGRETLTDEEIAQLKKDAQDAIDDARQNN